MSSTDPPRYSDVFTIAVLGKNPEFNKTIQHEILSNDITAEKTLNDFVVRENNLFRIISTHDFFDEECLYPDQKIIDFMAHSYDGLHLFILAIDSENAQMDEVVTQIIKLKEIFGETVTQHLAVVLNNYENYKSLSQLKEMFHIELRTLSEDLANNCKKWCSNRQLFLHNYRNYSEEVVKRRRNNLKRTSLQVSPWMHLIGEELEAGPIREVGMRGELGWSGHRLLSHQAEVLTAGLQRDSNQPQLKSDYNFPTERSNQTPLQKPDGTPILVAVTPGQPTFDSTYNASAGTAKVQHKGKFRSSMPLPAFNIILLGLTGTGKSASGNTILTAVYPWLESRQLFKSRPSATPVTTKCEFKVINVFGRQVRVVDTPDFFDDEIGSQAEVEECKKYCQPGNCVVLLVIQMSRFTDGERGILERLEEKLGWRIRKSTIVLLTHGENEKVNEQSFITEQTNLHSMVRACGNRFHVFKNTSKKPKQVKELFKKIPDNKTIFPELTEKPHIDCCLS